MIPKPPPLPRNDGLGFHEHKSFPPSCPTLGEPGPKESVSRLQAWSSRSPLIDGELMPKGQDLGLERKARSDGGFDGRDQRGQDGFHRYRPYRRGWLLATKLVYGNNRRRPQFFLAIRVFREGQAGCYENWTSPRQINRCGSVTSTNVCADPAGYGEGRGFLSYHGRQHSGS